MTEMVDIPLTELVVGDIINWAGSDGAVVVDVQPTEDEVTFTIVWYAPKLDDKGRWMTSTMTWSVGRNNIWVIQRKERG